MDALDLARWQFGITTIYHFLFVPLTIGLSVIVASLQTAWVRTGREEYLRATKFFGKLFLVNFAMGGAHAYCWNPMGLHNLPQHGMQPLDILKLNSPHFHADCKFILESLIPTSGSSSGKYFELRAREWGEAFVKMLVERDGSASFPSLYRTINAIESNTGAWPDILECMLASNMESVRRCAGEMLAKQ